MNIVSLIGFIGFGVSLAVHVATFGQTNVMEHYPYVMVLHVVALANFALFILLNKEFRTKKADSNRAFKQAFQRMPILAKAVLIGCFVYAAVNFATGMITTNQMKRDKTADPQAVSSMQMENQQLRIFSGHWMVFFLAPAMICFFKGPRRIA
ncbi:MAG TPA: hypothetical protein V6C76_14325 [Drouetiella sp.]